MEYRHGMEPRAFDFNGLIQSLTGGRRMKRNIAEEITNRILADLEKGVGPCEKPWKEGRTIPMPVNASTKKRYRGINVFVLWNEQVKRGFSSPAWLTFNQAKAFKGTVKKGEKGTSVVFYKRLAKTKSLNLDDQVVLEEQTFWVLKAYTVFNLDQVEGLDDLKPKVEIIQPFQAIAEAEKVLRESGAKIVHAVSNEAFFNPEMDFINLPPKENFESPEAYYGIALHELTHWTGHETRLNRQFGKNFSDQARAVEELVAEMGASFLCAACGIPYTTRHSDYIGAWVKVLKDHQRAILTAAAKAQAAMDFVLKTDLEESGFADSSDKSVA
jgi:antirestriction protein ArdC